MAALGLFHMDSTVPVQRWSAHVRLCTHRTCKPAPEGAAHGSFLERVLQLVLRQLVGLEPLVPCGERVDAVGVLARVLGLEGSADLSPGCAPVFEAAECRRGQRGAPLRGRKSFSLSLHPPHRLSLYARSPHRRLLCARTQPRTTSCFSLCLRQDASLCPSPSQKAPRTSLGEM